MKRYYFLVAAIVALWSIQSHNDGNWRILAAFVSGLAMGIAMPGCIRRSIAEIDEELKVVEDDAKKEESS